VKERRICRPAESAFQLHPISFVFVDRLTGTKRFEVNAGLDGSLPTNEAVSLLAM
jgi:hypothetical protein